MPSVLFVDDEPLIRNSLRLRFGRRYPDWDCVFAGDGIEALDRIQQRAFDVVVTDMRMPGMDGATLLGIVRERHPQTFRVVLSAQMSRDAQLRALPVTHRFHDKPCSPAALEQTIVQAVDLVQRFRSTDIARRVGGVQRLPAAPRVYSELTRLMADHRVGINQLAATVDRDPAVAARLLHVANSAFFGARRRIRTSLEALNWLGVDLTRRLVMTAELATPFRDHARPALIQTVQEHAMLTARIASRLVPAAQARVVSTAALLHRVGRLVLACTRPPTAGVSMGVADGARVAEGAPDDAAHADVGAYLLNLWGLPLDIVDAVANHLRPEPGPEPHTLSASGAIHIASALAVAARARSPYAPEPAQLQLDDAYLHAVGVQLPLHEWCVLASHQWSQMGAEGWAP